MFKHVFYRLERSNIHFVKPSIDSRVQPSITVDRIVLRKNDARWFANFYISKSVSESIECRFLSYPVFLTNSMYCLHNRQILFILDTLENLHEVQNQTLLLNRKYSDSGYLNSCGSLDLFL